MLLGQATTRDIARIGFPPREASTPRSSSGSKPGVYLAVVSTFVVLVCFGAVASDLESPRALYLGLLFLVCASPLAFAGRINGPYSILWAFLPFYFFCYGAADLLSMIPGAGILAASSRSGALSSGEVAVLLGALCFLGGYLAALRIFRSGSAATGVDWSPTSAIVFGFTLWLVGYYATWIMQTRWDEQVELGVSFSTWGATALIVGRMIEPVGLTLLAYQFVTGRSKPVVILLALAIAAEFVLGFVGDSKELALRGALIVILAKYLIDGAAPKKWLVVTAALVAMTFGVFQAYRLEVLQIRNQTRTAAAEDIKNNLDTALDSNLLSRGLLKSGLNGFVQRTSLKPTMELIVARVGADVEYQSGYTIGLILNGLIPRVIWPDKPDSSVGQLFNRQFRISQDRDTYISATHLGELYWNFGWPGIVVGMFVIGGLLGYVGNRFCLAAERSVTNLLVLITTIYLVCLRFEGGIALQYTLWVRSLGMIFILHLLFARRSSRR